MEQIDPRWWQIASLAGLVTYGVGVLRFDVTPWRIALEWKSAVISEGGIPPGGLS